MVRNYNALRTPFYNCWLLPAHSLNHHFLCFFNYHENLSLHKDKKEFLMRFLFKRASSLFHSLSASSNIFIPIQLVDLCKFEMPNEARSININQCLKLFEFSSFWDFSFIKFPAINFPSSLHRTNWEEIVFWIVECNSK